MLPNPAAQAACPCGALGHAADGRERRSRNRKQHPMYLLDGEDDSDQRQRARLFALTPRRWLPPGLEREEADAL